MNRRTLLVLGTAAVATVGAAVLLTPDVAAPPAPATAPLAFPGLAARLANAQAIEVRRHDGTLTIRRAGPDAWVLPDRAGYPVRPGRVRELLVGLTELRLTEPRTANPDMLDRLGLEEPVRAGATSSLLRVLDATGNPVAELIVGRRRVRVQGGVPESVNVRRPGEDQAWLAEGRLPVDADPQLWIDRDLANLARERVRRVAVQREGEPPLVLARGPDADNRLTVLEPGDPAPLDDVSLDEVARAFEFLTFLEVRRADDMPGTRAGEATFTLTDNLSIAVEGFRAEEQLWVRLVASGDEEAARLNARWQGWAYQVGQWKEKAFLPRIEDLRRQDGG